MNIVMIFKTVNKFCCKDFEDLTVALQRVSENNKHSMLRTTIGIEGNHLVVVDYMNSCEISNKVTTMKICPFCFQKLGGKEKMPVVQDKKYEKLVGQIEEAERLIELDKEELTGSSQKQNLDDMYTCLKELLGFRDMMVEEAIEQRYRYCLRYMSETLYIIGRYPRLEG